MVPIDIELNSQNRLYQLVFDFNSMLLSFIALISVNRSKKSYSRLIIMKRVEYDLFANTVGIRPAGRSSDADGPLPATWLMKISPMEMFASLPGADRLAREAATSWHKNNAASMGAVIAFYMVFVISPLLMIAMANVGFLVDAMEAL
jgi:hypothetical protein